MENEHDIIAPLKQLPSLLDYYIIKCGSKLIKGCSDLCKCIKNGTNYSEFAVIEQYVTLNHFIEGKVYICYINKF